MNVDELGVGDSVYVMSSETVVPGYTCFVGEITEEIQVRGETFFLVDGETGRMGGGGYKAAAAFPASTLGLRLGTPISRISTTPGTPGYEEWLRISASWGY